jgi:hypothetical protein
MIGASSVKSAFNVNGAGLPNLTSSAISQPIAGDQATVTQIDPLRTSATGSLVVVELVEDHGSQHQDGRCNNKTCANRPTVILAEALVHFIVRQLN